MFTQDSEWPTGDGEMAHRIRTHDWAATSLGSCDKWSERLRLTVEQVLASPLVATLVCGSDYLLIYNDVAASLYGDQHPAVLGQPLPQAFPEGWETVAPFYERAFAGEVVTVAGQPLDTRGKSKPTEVFDALLMPIRETNGRVAYVHMTGFDIAGRRQTEVTLRDGKQRLRLMLDHLVQATWETDAAGLVTTDSPSWRAYTGQSLTQWLGEGWLDAIHAEDRSHAEQHWREALAECSYVNAEFRLRSPGGGWRWTNVRAVPSHDDDGRVHKWLGVNIDIEARKQAERRQSFLLRLSDVMRCLTDSAELEPAAVGVLADELGVDRVFLAMIEPDGGGWHRGYMHADSKRGDSGQIPMSAFQHKRVKQWQAGRISSIDDSETDTALSAADRAAYNVMGARAAIDVPLVHGGRFAALLCVNSAQPRTWTEAELSLTREAAERIWAAVEGARAQKALREGQDRLRDVLDSMAEGFALLDASFVILDVNRETLRLDGRSREALVGWLHWEVFPGVENTPPGQMFKEVARTRIPASIEHPYTRADGRQLWLEMRVYPTREGGIAAFWRDVTDRRDADDALRRSEEKYRLLFDSMDEAYAVVEVLRDAAGEWADFRFVDANPAFTKHTTMPYPVGMTGTELLGSPNPRWARLYGQVLDTNQPLRVEESEATLGRTFDLNIFCLERQRDRVAVLFSDITERKRAMSALRESEARLAAAFDSVPVGIAVIDLAGRVIFSNGLYRQYLPAGVIPSRDPECLARWRGWSAEGRLLKPEEFPGARTLRGESVVPGQEMLFMDDAGQEIWTSVAAVPTRDAAGEVTGMVSVIGDIDAEKRSLIALRESEERLRQFGEASQDVLWIRDARSLQWQYLSPAFETIYGISREEALSGDNYRNWQVMIVEEDRARAVECIQRVARGDHVVFEYRIRRPADGQVRWLRNTDFPMGQDTGEVRRIGGVGHDVTAMKLVEEALAAAEQRQRLLVEGMAQLVWRAVDAGQWTWAGPQWIEHTGQSEATSQGHGWLDALHPDDREIAVAAWRRAPVDGLYQVDYRVRHVASGVYHWFQTRGIPVRHADGTILEWLGTSTDIDAQVRAREYLREASEELERRVAERTAELRQALDTLHREVQEHEQAEARLRQSEKLKAVGQLTGGIAHDFNNMLQGITSALALVRVRLAQGRIEAAQEFIAPAEKAATRAGALTHRLLAFSRQQTLAPRAVTLDHIARDMEDMIRRSVGPSVQVELKSADGHWLVLCDPNQMESALLNLCINARDAMPEGGWLTVSTEERVLSEREVMGFEELQPGRYAALAVTDTGTGMTPEVAARVFEPFFTTKPQGQGTGLGLSQIYGFIRQSGGLVQVETAPGKGTTVRLCLPFHEMSPQEPLEKLTNGKTILLVEDEHDLRHMLGAQLRDLGYAVFEADTADVALRVLSTGSRIDLLVTDIGLRGELNGRQLVQVTRDKLSNLPVIFITGYAGDNTFNGEVVLRKPFKPAVLALLVQEQIG